MILLTRAFFLLALVASTAFTQAAFPVLSNPTGIGKTGGTATLTVNVTTNGANTTVIFNYGLTSAYGDTKNDVKTDASGAQTATVDLSGLVPGSKYHFQVTASNLDGNATPTTDQTFIVPPFATSVSARPIGTKATLTGAVTANGTAGFAYFEYGLTNAYGATTSPQDPVAADAVNQTVQGDASPLVRNMTYHYRAVFMETGGITVSGDPKTFLTNNAPIARPDTINAAASGPTTINPLVNDSDPDGTADGPILVDVATQPEHGTAVVAGNSIIYTPDGTSTGFDTFTYTIEDVYGLQATGTISVRSIRAAFAGTHGGFIKRANGKEVGYFNVTATPSGSFTGIAIIDGKRFVVSGTISADGVYRGFATQGNSAIPVTFLTDQNENGSSVTALFDNGRWAADLTLSPSDRTTRPGLMGRYNAGLGAGGSGPSNGNDPGTPPDGSGWVSIRVSGDANASIKGRLSDGRSFSTKGTVNYEGEVATLTFYDDPEQTRVVGNLTLAATVGGTVRTDRHTSGEGLYPRGYDITQTADGARFIQPRDGKRILDTNTSKGQDLTISFSGGGLAGLSRDLYLDDRDKVRVLNAGSDDLKVRIDRKSGRFQAKFEVGTEGKKIKATGVLIQAADGGAGGRGIGAYNTAFGSGTVTISAANSGGTPSTPAPSPAPLPEPVVQP